MQKGNFNAARACIAHQRLKLRVEQLRVERRKKEEEGYVASTGVDTASCCRSHRRRATRRSSLMSATSL